MNFCGCRTVRSKNKSKVDLEKCSIKPELAPGRSTSKDDICSIVPTTADPAASEIPPTCARNSAQSSQAETTSKQAHAFSPSLNEITPVVSNPGDPQARDVPIAGIEHADVLLEAETPSSQAETKQDISDTLRRAAAAGWNGFKFSLKILNEASSSIPILDSVVSGLVSLLDTYDRTVTNKESMEETMAHIDRLLAMLGAWLERDQGKRRIHKVVPYINMLAEKLSEVERMQSRNLGMQIVAGDENEGKLRSICNSIADAIQDLQLGLSIEEDTKAIFQAVELGTLPRAKAAAYTAASATSGDVSRRSCTKDTRVHILDTVLEWALSEDPQTRPIYWTSGLAGQGKTTIAYTVCERLRNNLQRQASFASFFCSRQLDSHEGKLLVPTLVLQLAERSASFASAVLDALRQEHDLGDQKLAAQMERLFVGPWARSAALREGLQPVIIVVDGLDENDAGVEFVHLMLNAVRAAQLPGLRVLLTSRPDPAFAALLGGGQYPHLDLNAWVQRDEVNHDILKYLRAELPRHTETARLLEDLAVAVSGLFIYAATVVRLVRPDADRLRERKTKAEEEAHIRQLTSHARDDQGYPHQTLLNSLYANILEQAFEDFTDEQKDARLHILLVLIVPDRSAGGRSIDFLAALAGASDPDLVPLVIGSFHSVIYVGNDSVIRNYHASFEDFIRTRYLSHIQPIYYEVIQRCWTHIIDPSEKGCYKLGGVTCPRLPWELEPQTVNAVDVDHSMQMACRLLSNRMQAREAYMLQYLDYP